MSLYLAQNTNWGHFPDRSTRRKTSQSKDENQQQTQPTYDAESGNRTRATLVGGEHSHHCAIPARDDVYETRMLFCFRRKGCLEL